VSAAAAGTTAIRRPPRSRLWVALLVISLALNLCFVAGAVWSRMYAPPVRGDMAEHYRQMAGELDLDPQQRAAFDRYIAAMRTRTDQMRQETDPLIGAAWEEIAKPQPDAGKVERLFDESADKRRVFQREAASQMLALLATLSPAQRGKFVQLMRERRAAWRRQQVGGRAP
jgi:Spy/CpxP family protein refolding chaperone